MQKMNTAGNGALDRERVGRIQEGTGEAGQGSSAEKNREKDSGQESHRRAGGPEIRKNRQAGEREGRNRVKQSGVQENGDRFGKPGIEAGRNRPGQPGRPKEQMRRQLSRQKRVNRSLLAAILAMGILFGVSLAGMRGLYRRMAVLEEGLSRAVLQLQTYEADAAGGYRETPTYEGAAPDRKPETVSAVQEDYPDQWGMEWVARPMERTRKQVLEELERLAQDGGLLEEIYGDYKRYPDRLLEALTNNPEMAGFVAGYLNRDKGTMSGLTDSERQKSFPLFLQWDPRWGYAEYGDDSIVALSGCGPTCISMALYYLTGNEELTPDVIADYSMQNGYYVSGVGTAWALLEDVPWLYGVRVAQPGIREENLTAALDQGDVLICSMSRGDFTAAGHFIVIYGYDSEGFLVNDPNCVARSRMHWTWESLQGQIKNVWAYSRAGKLEK